MYQNKYLKYKNKYLNLKKLLEGGASETRELIYQDELTYHDNYFTQKILDDLYFSLVPLNINNIASWRDLNKILYTTRLSIYNGDDKTLKDDRGYGGFYSVINVINVLNQDIPVDCRFWCGILSKVPLIFNYNFDFNEMVFNNSQMLVSATHCLTLPFSSHMGIYRNPGYYIDNEGNYTENKSYKNVSILLHYLVAKSILYNHQREGGVELKYMITNPINVMRLLLMKYIYGLSKEDINYYAELLLKEEKGIISKNPIRLNFDMKIIKDKYNVNFEWHRFHGILKENDIEIVNLNKIKGRPHPLIRISSVGGSDILVFKLTDILDLNYRLEDNKFNYYK